MGTGGGMEGDIEVGEGMGGVGWGAIRVSGGRGGASRWMARLGSYWWMDGSADHGGRGRSGGFLAPEEMGCARSC
jgi:hypothetical protein